MFNLFVSGTTGLADVKMINAAGQVVRNWKQVNVSNGPASLDIIGLAPGMYMLHIVMPQSTTVEKLLIR
jgi:hypothetical protein